jgi:hypothetical protein
MELGNSRNFHCFIPSTEFCCLRLHIPDTINILLSCLALNCAADMIEKSSYPEVHYV